MTDTNEIDFDEVITKEPTSLSEEEKTFLTEHKNDLTTDEKIKFGFNDDGEYKPDIRATNDNSNNKKEEEEEEIDPEDEKNIGRVVSKITDPLHKQTNELLQQTEINNYLQENQSFAKYKNSIKAWLDADPKLTVKSAAILAAGDDLIKIGARREREAQKQARSTQTGSSTARSVGGTRDWNNASREEFEAKKIEILGHR